MSSGKLGSGSLVANVDTKLYTIPANKIATVSIWICNRTNAAITVSIAIGTGSSPGDQDYIRTESTVSANDVLRESGIVCSAGEKIWVRSNNEGVTVRVFGFVEDSGESD